MAKATTIRFTDEIYARLDRASSWTGMPVNSIVVAACLEWMNRHTPQGVPATGFVAPAGFGVPLGGAPRWSTIRRAVKLAGGKQSQPMYPFERFTASAQRLLTVAQAEADKSGFHYIGTEHLLLGAFADPAAVAARVLDSLGVTELQVRKRLDEVLGRDERTIVQKMVPTSRVKKVIELAFKLCTAAGDPQVSTGHVLIALATEGEGIAAHVLKDLGAPIERIESALESVGEVET